MWVVLITIRATNNQVHSKQFLNFACNFDRAGMALTLRIKWLKDLRVLVGDANKRVQWKAEN